ncbi:MAG: histidinol-phosphatase HisJ family protein [Clostridiaceae bacterium]|jgi:histidinol-phosphatase (PHP family)|nr:histidinol-phosphatase HisJ family protein [Clostridiaceae bacterium]
MRFVDTHNHLGFWSPDATQTYDQLMEAAVDRGLHGVAISDHYDPDCTMSDGSAWAFDPKAYMETFHHKRRLPSERNPGDPPGFLMGIELGWMPEVSDILHRVVRDHSFDFAIISVHYFHNYDPYTHADNIYTSPLHKMYTEMINTIADSAEDLSEAKIVGHYDFFSRYAPERDSKMLYEHAPEAFDRLFRVMQKNGQILEINVGTVNSLVKRKGYTLEEAMPDPAILYRYRELGGQYFSLASDAHHVEQNGLHMAETIAYLETLGIDEFAWFEDRELFHDGIS